MNKATNETTEEPKPAGIMSTVRRWMSNRSEPIASDWEALGRLLDAEKIDDAAEWCVRFGLPLNRVPLLAAAWVERKQLNAAMEEAEQANLRLTSKRSALEALERFSPATPEAAEAVGVRLAELRDEVRRLESTAGNAPHHWLRGLNQQFGELWGMTPAHHMSGGCSPAIFNHFKAIDCEPYRLHSWKEAAAISESETHKPRTRVAFSNE